MRREGSSNACGTVSEALRGPEGPFEDSRRGSEIKTQTLLAGDLRPPEGNLDFSLKNGDFTTKPLSKYEEKADNRNERLGCQPETEECS